MATKSDNRPIHLQLSAVERVEQILQAKKGILIEQAANSHHPSDIIKANTVLNSVTERHTTDRKSYLLDPYQFNSFMGYKDKPFSLSYGMLRKVSYSVPIVRAILGTRIDQIASFCEPQKDKYSIGFVIRKKQKYFNNSEDQKLTTEEMNKIEEITNFILNCGVDANSFETDDFDTFVRKIVNDSLTFDQMCFEIVRDRRGRPHSFYAVDAATVRIAESFDDDKYPKEDNQAMYYDVNRKKVKGYYPSYCQLKDAAPIADFYPWEMSFGVRNPSTNIYSNGYGISEIEILINTVTSMLWSDEYNRRFFSQGSAPKGLLKIKGGTNVNSSTLAQFRQQWQAMMAGVYNSWKTPILEGDVDWIDLQKSNNDMEFSKWQEYLIKLSTAIYRIDPAEINFPLQGGANDKPMFEGNNEARIKHSKDKGLYPVLKFLQRKFNKYLVDQMDPRFELAFCGLDAENPKDELESDIKMMTNFMTVDEIRLKRGLKALGEEKGGNVIANSIWYQAQNAKQQQEMAEKQMENGGDQFANEEEGDEEEGGDPFEKAFTTFMETLSN